MMPSRLLMNRIAALALLTLPSLALAHPGHAQDTGFMAGALHPLSGLDHLSGIVFAGLLLGVLSARARWIVGAGFLVLLGVVHAGWLLPPGAGRGFIAGLLVASAALIAAGIAATRMALRLTAVATRSRT